MKKNIFILILSFFALFSCSDDDGIVSQPVSDITADGDYGMVWLSWKVPNDENFYYVDVSFTDSKGNPRRVQSSHYAADSATSVVRVPVEGFADTKTYTFTLTPYSYTDTPGESQQVTGTPKTPPFELISPTVKIDPDFGGVIVSWENVTGKQVYIDVTYLDNSGGQTTKRFLNTATGSAMIDGLNVATDKMFTITVSDKFGNSSEERIISSGVYEEIKIDKTNWSIVDFSSDATYDNGHIQHVIDGLTTSFWHSSWSPLAPVPHWFIVDMKKEYVISNLSCSRRTNNNTGHKTHKFYTSIDGENWEDQGTFNFNTETNDEQRYRIKNNPTARYFKFYTDDCPNTYTHLSEISAYGQEK